MISSFSFKPIGVVHSPFKKKEDIDPQRNADPHGFDGVEGELEIFPEFEPGLKDIDGFSHLLIIFAFHQAGESKLRAKPPLDDTVRGIFATRSPHRPNPIGLTALRLLGRTKNILRVSGLDMIEGTPILDIKPYTAKDQKSDVKTGWIK